MTRVVMFGVDQMILPLTERMMDERSYPNLERILHRDGSVAEAVPCWPAWTPTNWATIATGADPGSHGVFGWEVPLPNGDVITSFHSSALRADTLWEAADRQGLRVGLVHYPATWPSRLNDGIVIDGCAMPGYGATPFEIASGRGYSTSKDLPISDRVELNDASGWQGLGEWTIEPRAGVLEIRAKVGDARAEIPFVVIGQDDYDRVVLSLTRDASDPLVTIDVAEWSDWCIVSIGGVEGRTRFRLIDCDPATGELHLWRAQVLPLHGLADPDSVMSDLTERLGPYQECVNEVPALGGSADYATMADEARYQMRWFARATLELLDRHGCDLVAFHWHWLDWVNHLHLGYVDPAWVRYDQAEVERHSRVIHDALAMIDEGLGIVLDGIAEDDVLVLLADHGNVPVERTVDFRRFLIDGGWMVLIDPNGELEEANIDWDRTKVYIPDRLLSPEFWVNPKYADEGRRIVERVVRELRTLVDPATDRTPVAIALNKREAALLGWYGPDASDIMVVLEQGYAWDAGQHVDPTMGSVGSDSAEVPHSGGQGSAPIFSDHPPPETAAHGHVLPTAGTGLSSNMAILAMMGSRIAPGYRRDPEKLGSPWLKDVAPTVAFLLGIDPPLHNSGTLLRDFLGVGPGDMQRSSPVPQAYRVPRDQEDIQEGMYDFSILRPIETDPASG